MPKPIDLKPADYFPVVDQIRPILAGKRPEVQAAIVADLVAILLAGHIIPGNPTKTDAVRKELLDLHVEMVRRLIPINAKQIHGS